MAQMPDLNVVCKNCGNEVSPYITECPYCGNRLRKRAPKIERDGTVSEPRKARKARKPAAPRLSRFRSDEIPGIRGDSPGAPTRRSRWSSSRCSATWSSSPWRGRHRGRGPINGEWWRVADLALPVHEHLVRAGGRDGDRGLRLAARSAATGRSWSLALFVLCGMGGIALAVAVDPTPLAVGGNGAALGLLCAWAVPDLVARRRGEEYDGDLLGTAVFAVVLLLMPLAVTDASAIAGFAGGAAGMLAGLLLARARIA